MTYHRTTTPTHTPLSRQLLAVVLLTGLGASSALQSAEQSPPPVAGTTPTAQGATDAAPSPGWPRRFVSEGHSITVYQPQPERLVGNTLTARAAISVSVDDGDPVFGAEWITAHLDIDREHRIAEVSSLTIDKIRFPVGEAGDQAAAAMESHLRRTLTPKHMVFDLDRLVATLEQAPVDKAGYSVTPPHILVRTTPTELLIIDGVAKMEPSGGIKRLVNSPAFVCVDATGAWWLRTNGGWLTAPGLTGPWVIGTAPAAIVASAETAGLTGVPTPAAGSGVAPAVIVASEPTELIEFDGAPRWTPIAETGILAAENCDSDAFMDTATQRCWLLLAGRWFNADHFADGASWIFCPPDKLPAGFAAIPAGSRWGQTRVHISGTDEAREATLDAHIPQTAHIPRATTITVTYDGSPRFAAIPGSDVQWAENTSFAVFQTAGPHFWCCSNAVWFEATSPQGPWTVATSVPPDLHEIPVDNPNHNVSYVDVYGSSDSDVVSGYTAGYLNEYTYDGTPIYGSGWAWPGYYGNGYWCPRPLTWGLRMSYDPWTGGWGMGVGFRGARGIDLLSGVGNRHGGWWGPIDHPPMWLPRSGLRPPPPGFRPPAGDHHEAIGAGHQPTLAWSHASIYGRVPGARLPSGESMTGMDAHVVHDHMDHVFVDHDGTVVRRTDAGAWEERRNKTWGSIDWNNDGQHAAPGPAQRLEAKEPRPAATVERPVAPPVERPVAPPAERPVAPPAERPVAPPAERPVAPEFRPELRANPEPSPRYQQLEHTYEQRERSTQRASAPMRSAPMQNGGGGEHATHGR
jgi:hypothetical protein